MKNSGNMFKVFLTILMCSMTAMAEWERAPHITPVERSLDAVAPAAMAAATASGTTLAMNETLITDEIKSLAAGLEYDPLKIFNYVRNEIDYEPGRGIYTGADGCLRLGKGNGWDQAALLIALLRESGISCHYVTEPVAYPRSFLSNWLGVEESQVGQVFASAGMLAGGITGADDHAYAERCWVEAEIGGVTRMLDPCVESFSAFTPVDWQSASSFDKSAFLSEVGHGATVTTDYVQNLNKSVLSEQLTTYTTNLIQSIKQNFPGVSADQAIWGRTKTKTELTQLPTSLPQAQHWWVSNRVDFDHVADADVLQVRIQYQGIDHSLKTYEFFGKPLLVTYNPSAGNRPELYVDEILTATGAATSPGSSYTLALGCTHPTYGGSFSRTSTQDLVSGGKYGLICQFMNKISARLIAEESAKLTRMQAMYAEDSVQVTGSSLRLMELYYFYQRYQSSLFLAHAADVVPFNINQMGVCGEQDNGVFFDLPGSTSGSASKTSDSSNEDLYYISSVFMLSALEHGVLEQLQELPGVSTARLLTLGNDYGRKTFYANASNWNSIQGQLINYSSSFKSTIGQNISVGYEYVLPGDASIGLHEWNGNGYVEYGRYVQNTPVGMIIGGGYNGGYGAFQLPFFPSIALWNSLFGDNSKDSDVPPSLSYEPVDLFTGNYVLEAPDLSLGGTLPHGLQLVRSYSSGQNYSEHPLGYGWTHNLDMRVNVQSRPQATFEAATAEQMAAQMVQAMVVIDLMRGNPGAQEWLASAMVADWGMTELTENIATVNIEGINHTFIELVDGSYQASGDGKSSLVFTNNAFIYEERNGRVFAFDTNNFVQTVTDPDGNQADFTWSNNRLDTVADEYGRQLTFTYSGNRLDSVSDSTGRSVQYEYDANQNLTNVTDVAGFDWNVTYDSEHRIKSLADPEQITTIQNFYDGTGKVTNQLSATGNPWDFRYAGTYTVEEDPLGNEATTYFDAEGRNLGMMDALGVRSWKFYDSYGRITHAVNKLGVTNALAYDQNHNLLALTSALGTTEQVVQAFGYDSQNRLRFATNAVDSTEQVVTGYTYTPTHHIDILTEAKGSAIERTTNLDYYSNGLIHQKNEGNGKRITTFTYDANGQPDTIASTDAGTIDYLYDSLGNMTEMELDGVKTAFSYDDRRLLTVTTFASGTVDQVSISQIYWDNGLLKRATDSSGNPTDHYWTPAYKQAGIIFADTGSTTNLYDAADRLVNARDAEGNWVTNKLNAVGYPAYVSSATVAITNSFDIGGNLTNSVIDPDGLSVQSRFAYDALNRMTHRYRPIGHEEYQMDALGRTTNRVDAASKAWKTKYDSLGRADKVFRPSGNFEEYGYDNLGNRTQFSNAERKPMTFGVDAAGRVTSITNAINKITRFGYDDSENLDWRIDANNVLTEYGYDALKRLVAVTNEGIEVATFDHDANGNINRFANDDSLVTLGYDEMNRLVASTQSVYSVSSVVQNLYDLNGNRTNIVYPGGLTVNYSFGADNRLESIIVEGSPLSAPLTTSLGYDGANRLTDMIYPNGVSSTFGYDDNGNMTSIQHGTFVDRTIIRNVLGFKELETVDAGLMPSAPENQRSIKTHNDADQLIGEWVQQGTNDYTISYDYSANGCLTNAIALNSDSVSYAYDYDNMLGSVDDASSFVQYLYDATGARVGRVTSPGVTNLFVIDYTDGLKRPLAETDATGSITRYYIWAGMRLLCHMDVVAGVVDPGLIRYYHADELGSTLALTDDSGTLTDQFAYMPYGYATHTGTTETPFQWLGGYGVYYDANTDLHLTLHRAYSSNLKRFIHPDPLGIDGGVNVFMWSNLNPLYFVDPYGLMWNPVTVAADYYADKIYTVIEIHYGRNQNQEGKLPSSPEEARKLKWDDSVPALYHQQGGATGNDKWVSPDGSMEVVFDQDGNIVYRAENMGTYNFADPNTDKTGHFFKDMVPYYLFGNAINDPTPWWKRITGPVIEKNPSTLVGIQK